jgi:catechol 2,3-dioxygenase-like lactoylglutathione lyase family enzyme
MATTTTLNELTPEEMRSHQARGPATGKINGVNHLMLVCKDFERSLRFYRDVLGFTLLAHSMGRAADADDRTKAFAYDSIAFFRVCDNIVFGLYELRHAADQANASTTLEIWPEDGRHTLPPRPFGMDHISWNVPTFADLLWFRDHLLAHGVEVSPVFDWVGGKAHEMFDEHWPVIPTEVTETPFFRDTERKVLSSSIYFYDPDGNALEISSTDWSRS